MEARRSFQVTEVVRGENAENEPCPRGSFAEILDNSTVVEIGEGLLHQEGSGRLADNHAEGDSDTLFVVQVRNGQKSLGKFGGVVAGKFVVEPEKRLRGVDRVVPLMDRNSRWIIAKEVQHFADFNSHAARGTSRGKDIHRPVLGLTVVKRLPAELPWNLARETQHRVIESLRFQSSSWIAPEEFVIGVPAGLGGSEGATLPVGG